MHLQIIGHDGCQKTVTRRSFVQSPRSPQSTTKCLQRTILCTRRSVQCDAVLLSAAGRARVAARHRAEPYQALTIVEGGKAFTHSLVYDIVPVGGHWRAGRCESSPLWEALAVSRLFGLVSKGNPCAPAVLASLWRALGTE